MAAEPRKPGRLQVAKTYKLFIGGAFPRTESGRVVRCLTTTGDFVANVSRASRKDFRDAVTAARKAHEGWAARTAFNRGQVLYRTAEMLESRRDAFVASLVRIHGAGRASAVAEVDAAVDRLVWYAGWCDKLPQVLGAANPVAGPFFNLSSPEPIGVVALFAPPDAPLLSLVSTIAPIVCGGNSVVVTVPTSSAVIAIDLAEVFATSDLPGGVVNILTAGRDEMLATAAAHRDVDAVAAVGLSGSEHAALEVAASESIKRVWVEASTDSAGWRSPARQSLYRVTPFLETKTSWHPMGS